MVYRCVVKRKAKSERVRGRPDKRERQKRGQARVRDETKEQSKLIDGVNLRDADREFDDGAWFSVPTPALGPSPWRAARARSDHRRHLPSAKHSPPSLTGHTIHLFFP